MSTADIDLGKLSKRAHHWPNQYQPRTFSFSESSGRLKYRHEFGRRQRLLPLTAVRRNMGDPRGLVFEFAGPAPDIVVRAETPAARNRVLKLLSAMHTPAAQAREASLKKDEDHALEPAKTPYEFALRSQQRAQSR